MAVEKTETTQNEYELFRIYRKTHDKAIRDELVQSYLYIAEILSRKFINRGIEYDDIYQVACMGVLYAVERYDPDRGVQFPSFATPTVLGEIRKYFRDKGNFIKIPRSLYDIFYKAEKIKRQSSAISNSELARILNLPDKVIEEALDAGGKSFIRSLEEEAYADGNMNLSNLLGAEDNGFLMLEDKDFINYCMTRLNDKEKQFINYRYYDEMSQAEIAGHMGMSQMNVSRLERRVLKKLRDLYFRD